MDSEPDSRFGFNKIHLENQFLVEVRTLTVCLCYWISKELKFGKQIRIRRQKTPHKTWNMFSVGLQMSRSQVRCCWLDVCFAAKVMLMSKWRAADLLLQLTHCFSYDRHVTDISLPDFTSQTFWHQEVEKHSGAAVIRKGKNLRFQLVKCEFSLVYFLLYDSKLTIFGLRTK